MSALSAAERVLREEGSAMKCREICRLALDRKYWQSNGKTPWATMGAQLYSHIRTRGAAARFVQQGPETFALNGMPARSPKGSAPRKPKLEGQKKLSFTQAAEKILSERTKKEPMHYREITQIALSLGLLDTKGQTPEATMYAQILTEIRRYRARGEQPRFVQHGRGLVSLSAWMGHGLTFDIEQHNKKVRGRLLQGLIKMKAEEFEHFISELLAKIGFEELKVTQFSGDRGIDVRGTLAVGESIRLKMAVQVKKWATRNVRSPDVRDVRGSLGAHERGLIITTSNFGKGAREEATRADAVPIALMNGEQLVVLMVQHEVMVRRQSHDILEIEEETPSV
ncbi:MAG: HTH domain-containing protein [Chthoniobacter sp.]|uniref:HTH domain-containing protein n=1 Tax=Chthoniobacter sp. TaxID=2510640 RepID=UPI0032A9F4D5